MCRHRSATGGQPECRRSAPSWDLPTGRFSNAKPGNGPWPPHAGAASGAESGPGLAQPDSGPTWRWGIRSRTMRSHARSCKRCGRLIAGTKRCATQPCRRPAELARLVTSGPGQRTCSPAPGVPVATGQSLAEAHIMLKHTEVAPLGCGRHRHSERGGDLPPPQFIWPFR